MKNKLQKLKNFAFAFCGWAYLWIVVVNVVGWPFFWHGFSFGVCEAKIAMFGEMILDCGGILYDFFSLILIYIPSFMLVIINMTLVFLKSGIMHSNDRIFEGLHWAQFTIPFFLIAIPGYKYWKRRSKWFAIAITIALIIFILYRASIFI